MRIIPLARNNGDEVDLWTRLRTRNNPITILHDHDCLVCSQLTSDSTCPQTTTRTIRKKTPTLDTSYGKQILENNCALPSCLGPQSSVARRMDVWHAYRGLSCPRGQHALGATIWGHGGLASDHEQSPSSGRSIGIGGVGGTCVCLAAVNSASA